MACVHVVFAPRVCQVDGSEDVVSRLNDSSRSSAKVLGTTFCLEVLNKTCSRFLFVFPFAVSSLWRCNSYQHGPGVLCRSCTSKASHELYFSRCVAICSSLRSLTPHSFQDTIVVYLRLPTGSVVAFFKQIFVISVKSCSPNASNFHNKAKDVETCC